MLLKRLFYRSRQTLPVRSVYEAIVARARQPELYTTGGVPDTLDGRYDMIVLHTDAVMVHLQQGSEADKTFAQELIDYGKVEQLPKLEGKRMIMILAPKK